MYTKRENVNGRMSIFLRDDDAQRWVWMADVDTVEAHRALVARHGVKRKHNRYNHGLDSVNSKAYA